MWQSLFGVLRPDAWRPLGFGVFFRDGWDEVYALAPGDAPRQTWINNADGAFYRLHVTSFSFGRGTPGGGNEYNGSFFLFSPLSRRLELGWFITFVVSAPDAKRGPGTVHVVRRWVAVGRYLTAADARYFSNFVPYLAMNFHTQLSGGTNTYLSLTPGYRFGLGDDWYAFGGTGSALGRTTSLRDSDDLPVHQELLDSS